jgi:hypothetical protein
MLQVKSLEGEQHEQRHIHFTKAKAADETGTGGHPPARQSITSYARLAAEE